MQVVWAEIFLSYIVIIGDTIMDINGKRFFESKKELKEWLLPLGLEIIKNKICVIRNTSEEVHYENGQNSAES